MPNLQRQPQELGRARYSLRDLCRATGGDADELEKNMTDKQPEALRLADALDTTHEAVWPYGKEAAAELRRLHAENERLKSCLFQMQEAAKWSVAKQEDDEALLRKCLREFQSFEAGMLGMFDGEFKEIISELRERLK